MGFCGILSGCWFFNRAVVGPGFGCMGLRPPKGVCLAESGNVPQKPSINSTKFWSLVCFDVTNVCVCYWGEHYDLSRVYSVHIYKSTFHNSKTQAKQRGSTYYRDSALQMCPCRNFFHNYLLSIVITWKYQHGFLMLTSEDGVLDWTC